MYATSRTRGFYNYAAFFYWIFLKLLWKANRRFGFPITKYPWHVYKSYKALECPAVLSKKDDKRYGFLGPFDIDTGLTVIEATGKEIWFKQYEDEEYTSSLHRWNWLFDGDYSNERHMKKINYAKSWLENEQHFISTVYCQPYNVSERIANFCLFERVTKKDNTVEIDFRYQIRKMAYYLSSRLEFNEPIATGNHVINNARALLLAGLYCDDDCLINLSKAIFEIVLPRLIGKDGFLIEGSSHYHFLVHRWLLEALWALEAECYRQYGEFLRPYVDRVAKASSFFLVLKPNLAEAPIFGDASPDIKFKELFSVGFTNVENGKLIFLGPSSVLFDRAWAKMIRAKINIKETATPLSAQINKIEQNDDCGWYRYDYKNWVLFINNNHLGSIDCAGHFHEDFSSFVLFLAGQRVFVDLGRISYGNGCDIARFQISAKGHNCLTVNGLSPASNLPNKQNIPAFLKKFETSVTAERFKGGIEISIVHDGFGAKRKNIIYKRSLLLKTDCFEISDKLSGIRKSEIESTFYIDPSVFSIPRLSMVLDGCSVTSESCNSVTKDKKITADKRKNVSVTTKRLMSHNYGELEPVVQVRINQKNCDNDFFSSLKVIIRN